jgi:hypothetical protein
VLWRLHARGATRPIRVERKAARAAIEPGPEDWLAWWKARGERELRCILMTAWDPIGVGDAAEAWDEYDSYALGVARRLLDASTADDALDGVQAYLNQVERDSMETLSDERARENGYLAASLVAWHEWSYEQDGRPRRDRW